MRQSLRLFFLSALFAYACSDDGGGVTPDAGDTQQPDAGDDSPDAGDPPTPDAGPEDTATALSLGASGNVGVVSTVGIPSLEVTPNVKEGVADSDAVVRRIDDEFYILNRALHNLTILDSELQVVDQFFLGGGANPQDVAVKDDTIYVATLGTEGIAVLDASNPGAGVTETITLSQLDPGDDKPNCNALHLAGDRLIATCQILDDDDPNKPARDLGVVAVIDTSANTLEKDVELARENPFSRLVETPADGPLGGDLLTSSVASFQNGGCIERIGLDGEPTKEGCYLEHSEIGGWVGRMAADGNILWMVVNGSEGTSVVSYDMESEALGEAITAEAYSPTDFAICPEGEMIVADNEFGAARGLRVYAEGEELTEELLDTGANPAFTNGLVCY